MRVLGEGKVREKQHGKSERMVFSRFVTPSLDGNVEGVHGGWVAAICRRIRIV